MDNKILVSVMLPTRQRTDLVKRSVISLLEKSADPTTIEVLIAYDNDDQMSKDYFVDEWKQLISSYKSHTQVYETPAWGYGDLNNYYNLLASNAQGQWLLLWNDDALMISQNWDKEVESNRDFLGMIHMTTDNFQKNLTLFPMVPKKWIDVFGCLSLSNLNDSWIQDICAEAGTVLPISSKVFHDRFDVTGNNQDSTYLNRNYRKKRHNSEEMKLERLRWASRWKDYVSKVKQTYAYGPNISLTQDH